MVGFAFAGAVAAIAIFVIVLVGLYRWTDLYKGPFAALTAVSTVTGLLAAVMFVLAFRRKPPNPSSAGVDRHAAALPRAPPVPLARGAAARQGVRRAAPARSPGTPHRTGHRTLGHRPADRPPACHAAGRRCG